MANVPQHLRDLVDQQINITERVRKLEVMQSSLTVRPKRWKPVRDDLDAITRHVMAMGPWDQRQTTGSAPATFPYTYQSRLSYYLLNQLERECYIDATTRSWDYNQQLAQDFTFFLRCLRVIPALGASPMPIHRIEPEPPWASVYIGAGETGDITDWPSNPWFRYFEYQGMTPAANPWIYTPPSNAYVPGGTPTPDGAGVEGQGLDELAAHGGEKIRLANPGIYVFHHNNPGGKQGDPYVYVGSDNCYYKPPFSPPEDPPLSCENWMIANRFVTYNPHTMFGQPTGPDIFAKECDMYPGGGDNLIGGQWGIYLVWEPWELILRAPPIPGWGQSPDVILRTDYEAAALDLQVQVGFPGWQWLQNQIQALFAAGVCPGVEDWYVRNIDKAKATYDPRWQWIYLNGTYRGGIEASVQDKHVHLRGHAYAAGDWGSAHGDIGAFPEAQVPPPAMGVGTFKTFKAMTGNGQPALFFLTRNQGGICTIRPWDPRQIAADGGQMVFDGVTWPTDQDLS